MLSCSGRNHFYMYRLIGGKSVLHNRPDSTAEDLLPSAGPLRGGGVALSGRDENGKDQARRSGRNNKQHRKVVDVKCAIITGYIRVFL